MENAILKEIIVTEKEVQRAVEQAEAEARDWLEARRKEIGEEAARNERDAAQSFEVARAQVLRNASRHASALIEEAEEEASRTARLKDETLSTLAAAYIRRIIPG